jgi:VWFA-related protein
VEVVVVAKDKHGPAIGLTKNDFTLFDNGRPQDIAFFSVRSVRDLASAPRTASIPALSPGVVSNRQGPNQEVPATQTVLLLDQVFTEQADQIFAIQRIGRFLDLRRKQDGVGIYTFGGGMRVVQDVTTDEDRLRRTAKTLKARDARNRSNDTAGMTPKEAAAYTALNLEERVRALTQAFEAIARHLADVPGRKNLVWITEGFPLYICNDLICVDFRPEMNEAARVLNGANVAVHAADARGLIGTLSGMSPISNAEKGPQPLGQFTGMMRNWANVPAGPSHVETLNLLAGLTGGEAYYNTNGIEESFQKAVQYEDVTYLLGFYPSGEAQDGLAHTLSVKVARPGVTLRYRSNYVALKPGFDAENRPQLDQLLKDPLDSTQIGLLAEATPDRAKPGVYNVHLALDLHDIQLYPADAKWVGEVEISFYLENAKSAQVTTREIEIPENQLAFALDRGLSLDRQIELQGKSSWVRVAVVDKTTGAAGSLRVPLGEK